MNERTNVLTGVAQWSANYSLGAKSSLPPIFVNDVSLQRGHMPAAHVVCAVSTHDGGGAGQWRLPMKPKMLPLWPFPDKLCRLLL